jgi:hypothetical protein
MENLPSEIRPLSAPSGYRQLNPAVLPVPPVGEKTRASRRRRLIVGFGVAAALHVGLVLAWWLTPPLRLKATYAPERWVQVLPMVKPEPPPAEAPPAAPLKPTVVPSAPEPRKKFHRLQRPSPPIKRAPENP